MGFIQQETIGFQTASVQKHSSIVQDIPALPCDSQHYKHVHITTNKAGPLDESQ
jgi:hypothetical protein